MSSRTTESAQKKVENLMHMTYDQRGLLGDQQYKWLSKFMKELRSTIIYEYNERVVHDNTMADEQRTMRIERSKYNATIKKLEMKIEQLEKSAEVDVAPQGEEPAIAEVDVAPQGEEPAIAEVVALQGPAMAEVDVAEEPAIAEVDVAKAPAEGHLEAEVPDEGESEQAYAHEGEADEGDEDEADEGDEADEADEADEEQGPKKKQKLRIINYSKIKKKYEEIEKKVTNTNYSRKRAYLQKNLNKRIQSNHNEGSRLVKQLPKMIYENDWYVTDIVNIGRDDNNNIALRLCFKGWHNGKLQRNDDKGPDYGEFVTLEEKELKEYFHSHADHFQMLLNNFFYNMVTNTEMLELVPDYKTMYDSMEAA